MRVIYSHNNSGGHDWLDEKQWEALRNDGWTYEDYSFGLNLFPSDASNPQQILDDAVERWQSVTGAYAGALGCNCCGVPHSFYLTSDDDKYLADWNDYDEYIDWEDDDYDE